MYNVVECVIFFQGKGKLTHKPINLFSFLKACCFCKTDYPVFPALVVECVGWHV